MSIASTASAQSGFEVNQFTPAPDLGSNYFSSISGRLLDAQSFSMSLMYAYTKNPLVVTDPSTVDPGYSPVVGNVMTSQNLLHLTGAYGVTSWFEVGVDVPLVLAQTGDPLSGLQDPSELSASFGIGDMRLVPKFRLLDIRDDGSFGGSIAALLDAGLPTGSAESFQGGPLRLEPKLAAEMVFPWEIRIAANLGYAWRESTVQVLDVTVESDVTWAVALDVPIVRSLGPVDRIGVVAEVFSRLSLETVVGAKADMFGFSGMFGFTAGLEDNTLNPDWRVFAALGYSGGFGSDESELPPSPTTVAPIDSDHDGIADASDSCPNRPEDPDQFEDEDGCPDVDNDEDGVTDRFDRCPQEPEDRDNFEDGDGCPEPDNDRDGVADADDACPLDPEDRDGIEDEDGCPDVELVAIDVVINFESDASKLPDGADYQLDRVAMTLSSAPRWTHYWIEGHADDSGSEQHNLELSEARANSVRNYLLAKGVDPTKVTAVGFAQKLSVRDNTSDSGKLTNRRVEFRAGPRSQKAGGDATSTSTPLRNTEKAPAKAEPAKPKPEPAKPKPEPAKPKPEPAKAEPADASNAPDHSTEGSN